MKQINRDSNLGPQAEWAMGLGHEVVVAKGIQNASCLR